jgi:hypothetical protein
MRVAVALTVIAMSVAAPCLAATPGLPSYLADRGIGIPTSMFGTYVRHGELLVYPFVEYYYHQDAEYAPDEFGYDLDTDFRGEYRAVEGLLFLGYGLTRDISVEMEVAVIDATQKRSPDDPTDMPDEVSESGLGDTQTQINWRWLPETENRPELFSFAEIVYPLQKDKDLIGTSDWEFKVGTGVIRGFGWGTMSARVAAEYSREEDKTELGEVAVDYLKRLSPEWRVYVGVEAAQDEAELITELQWHFSESAFLKLNNAFGITSKATDWAPEVGVMFSLF